MPRLNGKLTTGVPGGTWRVVLSVDPSSITTTSTSGSARRSRCTTLPTDSPSLKTGTMTRHFGWPEREDGMDELCITKAANDLMYAIWAYFGRNSPDSDHFDWIARDPDVDLLE